MTRRAVPGVTWSTIGQASPEASGESDATAYRWRGTPGWNPAEGRHSEGVAPRPAPQALRGSPRIRAEEKKARFAEFCKLRERGIAVRDAGLMAGVGHRAAARYERERKAGDDGRLAADLAEALREEQAAGLVRRTGREAWDIHREGTCDA